VIIRNLGDAQELFISQLDGKGVAASNSLPTHLHNTPAFDSFLSAPNEGQTHQDFNSTLEN
jgi:hypothetical protein